MVVAADHQQNTTLMEDISDKTFCPFHNCAPTYVKKTVQDAKTQDIALSDGTVFKYKEPSIVEHKLFCEACTKEMTGYEKDAAFKRKLGLGCVSISTDDTDDSVSRVNEAWNAMCSDIVLALVKRAIELGI